MYSSPDRSVPLIRSILSALEAWEDFSRRATTPIIHSIRRSASIASDESPKTEFCLHNSQSSESICRVCIQQCPLFAVVVLIRDSLFLRVAHAFRAKYLKPKQRVIKWATKTQVRTKKALEMRTENHFLRPHLRIFPIQSKTNFDKRNKIITLIWVFVLFVCHFIWRIEFVAWAFLDSGIWYFKWLDEVFAGTRRMSHASV